MEEYIDDFEHQFTKRLQQLRKESGYSYAQLEKLTGISRSTLQRYEKNNTSKVPISKLTKIANAYAVSEGYLMGYESKCLPESFYRSLSPLLKELGYLVEYDSVNDCFFLVFDDKMSFPVTESQLKELKDTTSSYLKFKLSEITTKPPTDK